MSSRVSAIVFDVVFAVNFANSPFGPVSMISDHGISPDKVTEGFDHP